MKLLLSLLVAGTLTATPLNLYLLTPDEQLAVAITKKDLEDAQGLYNLVIQHVKINHGLTPTTEINFNPDGTAFEKVQTPVQTHSKYPSIICGVSGCTAVPNYNPLTIEELK